jgi:hypothetical protein
MKVVDKTKTGYLFFLFIIFSQIFLLVQATSDANIVIYGDENCKKCINYISELRTELKKYRISDIKIRYYRENLEAKKDLHELHSRFNVPMSMRGNVVVIIDDKYIFEGYVSSNIITDFIINQRALEYQSLILYKDKSPNQYRFMDEKGEIKECQIFYSIIDCEKNISEPQSSSTSFLILTLILFIGIIVVGGILYTKRKKQFSRFENQKPHKVQKKNRKR